MKQQILSLINADGAQFFIVHGQPLREYQLEQIEKETGRSYKATQKAAYLELGGMPKLDGKHSVFGEVVEGFEVLHKIATAKTMRMKDPIMPDRPIKDIRITMKVSSPKDSI